MHHLFRQRPTPLRETRSGQVTYVLRRYGGLELYVPQFPTLDSGRTQTTPRSGRKSNDYFSSQTRPVLAPAGRGSVLVEPEGGVADAGIEPSSDSSDFLGWTNSPKPYGRVSPFCGGRILLGPEKATFFTFLLIFTAILVQVILEKDLIYQHCGGLPLFILGNFLAAGGLMSFLLLGISDPGVVPKNYTVQELMTETEEYRARHPVDRFYRYCYKCKVCRPPRTFHCSRCDICIRQQGVHFLIAGKCIGERNRRSFFFCVVFQTLLGIYLVLLNSFILSKLVSRRPETYIPEVVLTVSSLVTGISLLFLPQSGVFMLIYNMYLIVVGRTAREDYRRYKMCNGDDCKADQFPVWVNIRNYFLKASQPSALRTKVNRVVDIENILTANMPTPWALEQELRARRRTRSSLMLLRDSNNASPPRNVYDEVQEDNLNGNRNETRILAHEAIRLRQLADDARSKSSPSVPLLDQNLNTAVTRIKLPRRSKPSAVLQQKIYAFHSTSKLAKTTVSYHKRHIMPRTLSDGCIPRTQDGVPEMIQLSRATQLRQIIQMILLRDRNGLIEMSNRVNIAALIGMNRFDPDNLQLLELNNGLPMIAPRRREPEVPNHRLGAGVLGIPQMVAAGLLPTARDIAISVESRIGRGRVRRLPSVGRQRYTPITVVGPPLVLSRNSSPRRMLQVDEMDRIPASLSPNNLRDTVDASVDTGINVLPDHQDNLNELPGTPVSSPAPPSRQDSRLVPESDDEENNNNNNNIHRPHDYLSI